MAAIPKVRPIVPTKGHDDADDDVDNGDGGADDDRDFYYARQATHSNLIRHAHRERTMHGCM